MMSNTRTYQMLAAFSLAICLSAISASAQATGFRGDGSGVCPNGDPPTEWGDKKNVHWKTDVGGSYGCPIVVGDRVFVGSEPDKLLCLDRATGKILWEKANGYDQLPPPPAGAEPRELPPTQCGFTTPTPASDGKFVYIAYGSAVVAAYDLQGTRQWITIIDLPQPGTDGRSASPLIAGGKLLVPVNYLQALDPATGKVLWKNEDAEASFGTPVVAEIEGVLVAIMPKGMVVRVSDGKTLAKDIGSASYTSPVVRDGIVYFGDVNAAAVKLTKKNENEFTSKELWSQALEGEFFASPAMADGLLYAVNKDAVLFILDAAKGDIILKQNLELPPAGQAPAGDGPIVYGSVSVAGKRVFLFNNQGNAVVLEAGKTAKQLKANDLSDGAGSTPTFADRQIFIRGGEKLYCVEQAGGR